MAIKKLCKITPHNHLPKESREIEAAIAVPATSGAVIQMMKTALSLSFQLRKRSPDVPRYRPFLAIYAHDEGVALQSDKRRRMPFQKLGQ
jgi:hypothetical protein